MENKEITTKICFRCETSKEISEYYKHKQSSDGYLGKCKSCTKNDNLKNLQIKRKDPKWVEKERKRTRDKYHRLGYKKRNKPSYESKKKAIENYFKKFPEKKVLK